MNTVYFHVDSYPSEYTIHSYWHAKSCIKNDFDIHTTQMCLLNEAKKYDAIYIYMSGDVIKIINNHDGTYKCNRTTQSILSEDDFFEIWKNGLFDKWND